MKRSMFIHGLTGSGVALIATFLYVGLASADSVVPPLQPTQPSPIVPAIMSDKLITSGTATSTTVVSRSETTLVVVGATDKPSAASGSTTAINTSAPALGATLSGSDNMTSKSQLVPEAPADSKATSPTNAYAVTTIPGSDVVKSLANSSAGVFTGPEALSAKRVITPLQLRTSNQAFSEQGSEPSVVMVAPAVLGHAPTPGPTPIKSSGILTQIGELLRHLFAPLVAGFGALATTPSGNSSWPIFNFSALLLLAISGLCYASYLSLLRLSGYQHGARSDADGRQTYGDAIINGLLSRRVLRHPGQPIFSGVSSEPSFILTFINA